MTRLTVVGSLDMDLVIRSSHIPKPGETIIGSDFQTIPGGKGANQAVVAAKLGAQVSMVGRVGGTIVGAFIIGVLSNGLNLMVIPSYYQQVIKGLVFILAVTVDLINKRRR
jgi:ribokinase